MKCGAPHPVRAAGGVDLAAELEVVGSHATEAWVRCRACGSWFWTSTDLGSKFEYVGEKPLDPDLAEAAFLRGDVRAAARLLVSSDEPFGPVWTTASALLEMLRAVTPGANDRARSEALDAAEPGGRWAKAANVLRELAKKQPPTASELVFELDARFPGRTLGDAYELGDALVIFQDAPTFEMIRITRATGVGSAPLPHAAELLARNDALLLFDVDGAMFMLDTRGGLTSLPPTGARYVVSALDDGWWLFVPQNGQRVREVEFHRPDAQPRVKLKMAFREGNDHACSPRRMGDGWIVSGCVDVDGREQALTLFDSSFQTIAFSSDARGQRVVAPIDEGALWCETVEPPYTLERWERRGRDLVRTFEVASQSWIRGDGFVVLSPRAVHASITSYDDAGKSRFSFARERAGATYFCRVPRGLLVYDDRTAQALDPLTGERFGAPIPIEDASVLEAKSGAVYLRTQNALWVFGEGEPVRVFVGEHMRLETTCGDAALLRDRRGDCLVVGSDGSLRASFRAPHARFSVVGTRGGPYVVEPEHVRVAHFPR